MTFSVPVTWLGTIGLVTVSRQHHTILKKKKKKKPQDSIYKMQAMSIPASKAGPGYRLKHLAGADELSAGAAEP